MKCRSFLGKTLLLGAVMGMFLGSCMNKKAVQQQAEQPYALNVVYFLPQGIAPVPGYEDRLNDLIGYVQDFYGSEMKRNNFGEKTFGLARTPEGKIKLTKIEGKETMPYYAYDNGGGWKAEKEIEAYYALNPGEKKSDHVLVLMPSVSGDDMHPGGVPFYGIGKYCFALDYTYFDIKYLGQQSDTGRLLTKWFGGMAHELGHGLNLPHNMQQVSVEKEKGTALMGAGNYTFGLNPTYLTEASCAILNNCQVFALQEGTYYGASALALKNMDIRFTPDTIYVSGAFTASVPVNAVNIYYDHAPFGQVNNDYDAESWSVKPGNDSFALSMPVSELHKVDDESFQIRVLFLHQNGAASVQTVDFLKSDLKDYHYSKLPELDRTGWSITVNDCQDDSPAINLLDGRTETVWHSAWSPAKSNFPYVIKVEMKAPVLVAGLSFVQRENLHGALKDINLSVLTSADKWENAGQYILANTQQSQYITFSKPMEIKAFKVEALSNYSENDPQIGTLAEIGAI